MEFKKGQIVELVNNEGMSADVGATAVVIGTSTGGIFVQWKTLSNNQMDGMYLLCQGRFKPLIRKNQQLLFAFMSEAT